MAATLLVKPDINDVKLASKSSTPSTTSVFEEGLFDLSPQLRLRPTIHQSRPPKELLILSPKAKGKYPVIIFLHGFSLSNSYYTDLLKHIASHGYIIVAPQLYNVMPVPAWSGDGEIKSTAAVTDWLPKGLQSVLSENNGKAEMSEKKKKPLIRRCRGSNPGHPRDRREYLPLYYNDIFVYVRHLI
ncbi:hypothetical protein AQUCO_01700535v1 [Aquilegia coerulea]|uniref:Uncharacterized protein n=1 Tax=Aquilegia coerulea TaxID=218851 RepID=A0A2G5DNE8_AQUCA|nr:hypothetical protein AQUCO_01700535v1 [Aquilegia coerulea]